MWLADSWKDYEVLDTSAGEKLERWGKYILVRPDPQVIWNTPKDDPLWRKYDARYARSNTGGGKWQNLRLPAQWQVRYKELTFQVKPMNFKHTGVFPEQAANWDFMMQEIRNADRPIRVLNLFAYTGVASVQAAVAGAASTTSVDLSATYLQWCADNLALNGLGGASHQLVQGDALAWLEVERGRYDVIFCDPPTFSNSARADDFDVQREHVRLLRAACARLAQGGALYFSNNFRRFRLDAEAVAQFADCEEISASTIPPDFERNGRIHRAWRLTVG